MSSADRPRRKTVKREFSRFRKDLTELMEDKVPALIEDQVFQEMLFNIGQLKEEKLDITELRLLNTAFKELRYALKVFKPYRKVPKAAVFGSARTPADHSEFRLAQAFGRKLADKGWMVITGGASGIMEAAMIGAGAERSFGLNILLPFEQEANKVIKDNPKLIFFKYFFTRKLMFLKESEATVLFPGGFGTFDEGFESFTLVQTGKAKPRPLVLIDSPGSNYWNSVLHMLKKNMEDGGLIAPDDRRLMRHFQNAGLAVKELTGFYGNYHSSRFFKDLYLIRLRRPVPNDTLDELGRVFKDILVEGGFERLKDTSQDDVSDPSLHRIVFAFNRVGYARLRQLIDRLNRL